MAKRNPRRSNGHRRDQLIARHRAAGRDCYICGRQLGGVTYGETQPTQEQRPQA